MPADRTKIDQSRATAGGPIVAGDYTVHHHHAAADPRPSIIEQLLERLVEEMRTDQQFRDMIEGLQQFHTRRSHDGIEGLEAKLKAGGRSDEILDAMDLKERFVKVLDHWSHYGSAQEIFAYLLAKAEHEFRFFVFPQIGKVDALTVNQMVTDRIVYPLVEEVGTGVLKMNAGIVMGMVYWLAEQCYIRWHQ